MTFDWKLYAASRSSVGANLEKAPLRVAHASLTKVSEKSDFKVECPACRRGMLLVRRDPETLGLVRNDNCIFCAQRYVYTDESIGGEPLEPEIR